MAGLMGGERCDEILDVGVGIVFESSIDQRCVHSHREPWDLTPCAKEAGGVAAHAIAERAEMAHTVRAHRRRRLS